MGLSQGAAVATSAGPAARGIAADDPYTQEFLAAGIAPRPGHRPRQHPHEPACGAPPQTYERSTEPQ